MSKPLIPLTVEAPGFLGLNTQQAGSILPPGWATVLDNFVFDDSGRVGSRMGSRQINGTVITSTPTVQALHEYVDSAGVVVNIVACDNKIYKEVSGTMTDVSGTITTPTANHWQFVNFNGKVLGFQKGEVPIVRTSGDFSDASYTGTGPDGNCAVAAFGRVSSCVACRCCTHDCVYAISGST